MFPVTPRNMLKTRLNTIIDVVYDPVAGPSAAGLFINDVMPDANSNLAQFDGATFTGGSPIVLTMSAASVSDQGLVISVSNLLNWLCTVAPAAPEVCYGMYVYNFAGLLVAAQRFDEPQTITNVGDSIVGLWRTSEPLTNYGWINVE